MDQNTKSPGIGIECYLGLPRPDHFFRQVLRKTGLKQDDFEEPVMIFGAWMWRLKEGDLRSHRLLFARAAIRARLEKLRQSNRIRGAFFGEIKD